MSIYSKLVLLLMLGLLGGRVARKLKLPNVTGYLLGGLLLGPSFFGIISDADVHAINFVNELALSAIAFNIGGEFLIKMVKRIGKKIFIITLFEVIGALAMVFSVMYFLAGQSFAFSMVVASMSAATAPAGTLMVIKQYKAKGPMTDSILPIAALDDAMGIMVFGLALTAAQISLGSLEGNAFMMALLPFIEIFVSLLVGFILGLILSKISTKIKSQEELIAVILMFILASPALAHWISASPLLVSMMMGATYVNLGANPPRTFASLNSFMPPFNVLFFAFAGASLDLKVLGSIGLMGLMYVLARMAGKVIGTSLGAKVVQAEDKIVKYLGFALLPQGGISIGLSMIVRNELPEISDGIVTLILFSVLVFEILGPILAKVAITKAGEITEG